MKIPKKYGQSKTEICPFCGKNGVTQNSQGISVCTNHKNNELSGLKCICGEWLDIKKGKWGPYFSCMRCGNINFRKGMEMNPDINKKVKDSSSAKENSSKKEIQKETTITSDDIDLY